MENFLFRKCASSILRGVLASAIVAITFGSRAELSEPREELRFGTNPGNLRMFSYVPSAFKPGGALIVVLHGCKQNAASFAREAGWQALADRTGTPLLLPEQKGLPWYLWDYYTPWLLPLFGANNQNACFNWFEPDDTARDHGEVLSIREMIDAMIGRYAVDHSRVYIAGLSAGGAMTAVMLATYPERLAGAAIVAGVPYGCAGNVYQALGCMKPGIDKTPDEWRRVGARPGSDVRVPVVSIWHGTADDRVALRNAQELVEQWTAVHGIPTTAARSERIGHITREAFTDGAGATRVERVVIEGLGHAFPIRDDVTLSCGRPGNYVVAADVCATTEIARFWGLTR